MPCVRMLPLCREFMRARHLCIRLDCRAFAGDYREFAPENRRWGAKPAGRQAVERWSSVEESDRSARAAESRGPPPKQARLLLRLARLRADMLSLPETCFDSS